MFIIKQLLQKIIHMTSGIIEVMTHFENGMANLYTKRSEATKILGLEKPYVKEGCHF